MGLGDFDNNRVLEENGGVFGLLPFELDEGLRTERAVCGDGNSFRGGKLEESGLDKVRVVFYLEGCRAYFWRFLLGI